MSAAPPLEHHRPITRSYSGCWTCRLRRKKCDEKYPVCAACTSLAIACHYEVEKPTWMDGGARQEEMAEQIKRDVRSKNRRLHGSRNSGPDIHSEHIIDRADKFSQNAPIVVDRSSGTTMPTFESQTASGCRFATKDVGRSIAVGRRDAFLFTYHLDHVLPLLFPFYRPSLLNGGRAWILEMMITSPVMRQATLCQSSYFFLLSRDSNSDIASSDTVLSHTREAFRVLREALQVIHESTLDEHLNGAIRILASIMQVQRFDVAVSSFDHCQAHLSAALALFERLLETSGKDQSTAAPAARFLAIIDSLGLPEAALAAGMLQLPSAEQDAFRFSAALLILDDIVASTVYQVQPTLSALHDDLLRGKHNKAPHIDLSQVMGCENWPLLQIGRISALNAWKLDQSRAGSLNMAELVRRSEQIKNTIDFHLFGMQSSGNSNPSSGGGLVDALAAERGAPGASMPDQGLVVTRIWGIAALLYLSTVVSGCQPAADDVRFNVAAILDVLSLELSPPTLLRTVVWPFCVAGCLAEKPQECHFRQLVQALQPASVFGTVHKAFEIMERAWHDRESSNAAVWELATFFHSDSELILLI